MSSVVLTTVQCVLVITNSLYGEMNLTDVTLQASTASSRREIAPRTSTLGGSIGTMQHPFLAQLYNMNLVGVFRQRGFACFQWGTLGLVYLVIFYHKLSSMLPQLSRHSRGFIVSFCV